jgi:hypothetical protein
MFWNVFFKIKLMFTQAIWPNFICRYFLLYVIRTKNEVYSRLKSSGMWRYVVGPNDLEHEGTTVLRNVPAQWRPFTWRHERYHLPQLHVPILKLNQPMHKNRQQSKIYL